jgi:hypothetical protein
MCFRLGTFWRGLDGLVSWERNVDHTEEGSERHDQLRLRPRLQPHGGRVSRCVELT